MNQERANIEAQLIEKAWKDDAFRQDLISDPRGTVAREFGVNFPEGIDVKVIEETADTYYMVLPRPETTDVELTDAELELVAGGSWCGFTCGGATLRDLV